MGAKTCAWCEEESAEKQCGSCRLVFYCGAECQRNDWKLGGHKKQCGEIALQVAQSDLLRTVLAERQESYPEAAYDVFCLLNTLRPSPRDRLNSRLQGSIFARLAERQKAPIARWFLDEARQPGDLLPETLLPDIRTNICDGVRQEASNSAPLPLYSSRHLAVGFVDLGMLAFADGSALPGNHATLADALEANADATVDFVGVDATAAHVAKALVVWEMARSLPLDAAAAIAEVWACAMWSDDALEHFRAACDRVLATPRDADAALEAKLAKSKAILFRTSVRDIVKAFRDGCEQPYPAELAWDRLQACSSNDKACARRLAREEDRKLSANIMGLRCFPFPLEISVGSGTAWMDGVPGVSPHSATPPTVLVGLPVRRLVRQWRDGQKEQGALVLHEAAKVLLEGAQQLVRLAQSGRVRLRLLHGLVGPGPALESLASEPFRSVSWSNVPDGYCKPGDIHALARTLGTKDCLHSAYSMNWTDHVFGSHPLDARGAPEENVARWMEQTRQLQRDQGVDGLLRVPGHSGLLLQAFGSVVAAPWSGRWVQRFLAAGDAFQGPENWTDNQAVPWAGLSQCMCRVSFAWTYDKAAAERPLPSPLST